VYKSKTVAVVVPAYKEEKLIGRVIETMPECVDHIIVVDDCSPDRTSEVVQALQKDYPQVVLIRHEVNQGVGGAIATGYKWARDHQIDATAVMAGDAQMHPDDLPNLLDPVVAGQVDYAKGNRLISGEAWYKVPRVRYLGNAALSLLTKVASGYWHVADSQTGYTVINLKALQTIDPDLIYKRYGMPNDLLVRLNIYSFRVRDVEIKPVYGIGEQSGLRPFRMMPKLALLIFRLFIKRMVQKYVIRDFHPLVFFYILAGFLLAVAGPLLSIRLISYWIANGRIPPINALTLILVIITGLQFLLFAMWFDMDYNRDLQPRDR
jgi:glycosyltransferase involved in cell wall biosynthesis